MNGYAKSNESPFRIVTSSAEETFCLGSRFAALLEEEDVVFLIGTLGAGKTVFAKGIAVGLGVPADEEILSPTYTFLRTYRGRIEMNHLDLYRLLNPEEAWELVGMAESGLLVVEWPMRGAGYLPEPNWVIEITIESMENRGLSILGRDRNVEIEWP